MTKKFSLWRGETRETVEGVSAIVTKEPAGLTVKVKQAVGKRKVFKGVTAFTEESEIVKIP